MGKLSRHKYNLEAWHGDAALLWIVRLVLTEKYPNLPLRFLMQREGAIINNSNLNRYCKQNGLEYGPNIFELQFGKLVFSDIEKCEEIVCALMTGNKNLENMDADQLENGQLNKKSLEKLSERVKKQILFKEISLDNKEADYHTIVNLYQEKICLPHCQLTKKC